MALMASPPGKGAWKDRLTHECAARIEKVQSLSKELRSGAGDSGSEDFRVHLIPVMGNPATGDMKDSVLRVLTVGDADRILDLNNEHAVETSLLNLSTAEHLLAMCFYAKSIGPGARGFLLALDQDAAYDNQNFHWFRARFESFVYIDRIIVAQDARGQGLARLMYEELFASAKAAGHVRVVCEVNIDPPNEGSLAFHRSMGFVALADVVLKGGGKRVRYLVKELG